MNNEVQYTVMHIEDIAQQQCDEFIKERLDNSRVPLAGTIKKNELPLFSISTARVKTKLKGKMSVLKSDVYCFRACIFHVKLGMVN